MSSRSSSGTSVDVDVDVDEQCRICFFAFNEWPAGSRFNRPNLIETLPRIQNRVCGHSFHALCLKRWLQSRHDGLCPLCKTPVPQRVRNRLMITSFRRERIDAIDAIVRDVYDKFVGLVERLRERVEERRPVQSVDDFDALEETVNVTNAFNAFEDKVEGLCAKMRSIGTDMHAHILKNPNVYNVPSDEDVQRATRLKNNIVTMIVPPLVVHAISEGEPVGTLEGDRPVTLNRLRQELN